MCAKYTNINTVGAEMMGKPLASGIAYNTSADGKIVQVQTADGKDNCLVQIDAEGGLPPADCGGRASGVVESGSQAAAYAHIVAYPWLYDHEGNYLG